MKKTIKVEEETHKRLLRYGHKNETFDSLFNRLLDEVERQEKNIVMCFVSGCKYNADAQCVRSAIILDENRICKSYRPREEVV